MIDALEVALRKQGVNLGVIRDVALALGFSFEGQSKDYFCRLFKNVSGYCVEVDVYWQQGVNAVYDLVTDSPKNVYSPLIETFALALSSFHKRVEKDILTVFDSSRLYRWQ
ncbi:hypothetical protein HY486_00160 [Candidatus Woesearchaeota archaeon]|nr:hypothetical protein [Candidatus Woesearchaeota archaeon]